MDQLQRRLWLERWGGWTLVGLLTAIPVVRWLMLVPLNDRFIGSYGWFTSLGRVAGLIGFMFFAINLLLSIRKRFLEDFFGGLNRVYIAHHILGGLAFIFILLHPLLLSLRYIELQSLVTVRDAAHFLLPRSINFNASFPEVVQASAINDGIIGFVGLTGLLIIAFFVKLPYRVWLVTHKFIGLAFLFTGLHVLFVVSDITDDRFLRLYIGLWVVIGLSCYVYRTLLGAIFVRRIPYKVDEVKLLSDDVVTVAMHPVDRRLDFQAGQFVFVRFLWAEQMGISREAHPFSIATTPTADGIRLYMKSLGDFTRELRRLKPGVIAEIEGAFGRFLPARYVSGEQIWIAGGIGITPFLATARSFTADSPPVTLFYAALTKSEMLDRDALEHFLPRTYPQFRYVPFLSSVQKSHLTASKVEEVVGDVHGKEIFICGPPPMMKALRTQFKASGVPGSKIHTEEFAMS